MWRWKFSDRESAVSTVHSFRKSFNKARVILAIKTLLYWRECVTECESEREREIYFQRLTCLSSPDQILQRELYTLVTSYLAKDTWYSRLKTLYSQRNLSPRLPNVPGGEKESSLAHSQTIHLNLAAWVCAKKHPQLCKGWSVKRRLRKFQGRGFH